MPPANAIAATFFGQLPESVTLIENRGSVNQVYLAQTRRKRVIVRLPHEEDKERAGAFYAKEAWCLAQAAALGIPGPTVLALGKHDRWPYQLLSYIEGTPGEESSSLWQTLGEYARRLHGITLDGFGETLPEFVAGEGRARWHRFIDYNAESLMPTDRLCQLGVYTQAERPELLARFTALRQWQIPLGLCHGDLSPRNTLVGKDGTVFLLDWGCAEAHLVPHYDLLGIPADALPAFLDGYGAEPSARGTLLQEVEALRLLKAFDLTRWAIERCPTRLDELATRARQTWAAVKDKKYDSFS